jgi:pterin-4a-carbinolamine dehydratase
MTDRPQGSFVEITKRSDDDHLVFISYRRADSSAAARWLAESVGRTFGSKQVFIDTDSIRLGEAWPERIDDALASATILLPIIGPNWLRIADDDGRRRLDNVNDWVCREIRHALREEIPIIPLLLSNTQMPSSKALPKVIARLANVQGFELRDDRWESDLSILFRRLEEIGLKRLGAAHIRYPLPKITIRELTGQEINSALEVLSEWTLVVSEIPGFEPNKRSELFRTFEFASFEDAIAFMTKAVPRISQLEHHPRWENLWRTVRVWLSTWDIGHKPSMLDLELARYLEELRTTFPPPKGRSKEPRSPSA